MAAALDDAPAVEDDDLIERSNRVDPTRDDHHRPSGEDSPQLGLDPTLGLRIHRGERVVEDQDAGIEGERAGERRPLALAAREHHAPFADEGVEALGQVRDVTGELGTRSGPLYAVASPLRNAPLPAGLEERTKLGVAPEHFDGVAVLSSELASYVASQATPPLLNGDGAAALGVWLAPFDVDRRPVAALRGCV